MPFVIVFVVLYSISTPDIATFTNIGLAWRMGPINRPSTGIIVLLEWLASHTPLACERQKTRQGITQAISIRAGECRSEI
jgi:hypothetical protein